MRLLIVDDHPINLNLLRAQLEGEGHVVFDAADGVEALDVLKRQPVDVVISDILMPRMDGYRLCHEVRKSERLCEIPFIFYTSAYTSPADEKLALEVGANKYLKKPASVATMSAALQEVIAQPRTAPRPEALQGHEVLKEYSERLVSKLEEKISELTAQTETLLRTQEKSHVQGVALESAANAIIITDRSGAIQWVNPAFTTLTGYAAAEVVGKTPRVLKSGNHDTAFYRELWRTILSGQTWRGEFTNRRKDGSLFHDEHTITPVRSEGGEITHFIGILHDVTERKRAEDALRESEERMRLIIETALDAVITMDAEGYITSWNPQAEKAFGWSREEIMGQLLSETIIPPRYREHHIQGLKQFLATGSGPILNKRIEITALNRQGHEFPVELAIAPVQREGKWSFSAFFRDITERRGAEEAFKQRAADLENFHRLSVGREFQMIELKKEVNELARQAGRPPPYDLSFLEKSPPSPGQA